MSESRSSNPRASADPNGSGAIAPHHEPMKRQEYEQLKARLQVELLKMQNWVKTSGERIVILFCILSSST